MELTLLGPTQSSHTENLSFLPEKPHRMLCNILANLLHVFIYYLILKLCDINCPELSTLTVQH